MKTFKEINNVKSREELVKDMIEKEKVKDKVFKIQKSPNSNLSQKMIKKLNAEKQKQKSIEKFFRRKKILKSESSLSEEFKY